MGVVCLCVCMHVRCACKPMYALHVCKYIFYMSMFAFEYVGVYVCMRLYVNACVCMHSKYMCDCVCVYRPMFAYVCMYVFVCE